MCFLRRTKNPTTYITSFFYPKRQIIKIFELMPKVQVRATEMDKVASLLKMVEKVPLPCFLCGAMKNPFNMKKAEAQNSLSFIPISSKGLVCSKCFLVRAPRRFVKFW